MIYTLIYTYLRGNDMEAKLFENGRSQAVRLPKEYRFDEDSVIINKIGDAVILLPKNSKWASFVSSLSMFPSDYMSDGRVEEMPQERENI